MQLIYFMFGINITFKLAAKMDTNEQIVACNVPTLHMVKTANQCATVLTKPVLIETDAIV